MTPLDEMRANAEIVLQGLGIGNEHEDPRVASLCRAVLAMLPVVEAATAQERASSDGRCTMRILAKYELAIDATNQAVAAFRAANREGETKAT